MRKYLCNEKGQSMVEFGLTLPVFLLAVFLLFASCMWGTASFFAHDAALETAGYYASRGQGEDRQSVIDIETAQLNKWASPFIVTGNTKIDVWSDDKYAYSKVTVTPKFIAPFGFGSPVIIKTSHFVFENCYAHPDKYM